MSKQDIRSWLSYFNAARMVAFKEIKSLADVGQARRFCACLRVGVFANVTDGQIWYVLREFHQEFNGVAPSQAAAVFKGYDAEGLAIYGNVVLS